MSLEIVGKVFRILPEQSGSSRNGQWVKQEFVIETNEQFPKKVCLVAWGDKVEDVKNLNTGEEVKVSFNVESREYNERWYTDVKAWKIEKVQPGASGKKADYDLPPVDDYVPASDDDLPF